MRKGQFSDRASSRVCACKLSMAASVKAKASLAMSRGITPFMRPLMKVRTPWQPAPTLPLPDGDGMWLVIVRKRGVLSSR